MDEQNLSIRIGSVTLESVVALAPMAGVTDLPFRRAVRRFGPQLVVSEMIASKEFLRNRGEAHRRAARDCALEPCSVQLVGHDPNLMAETARAAEGEGAQIIDINMGCPARLVTGSLSGSALMRDPAKALRIIEGVVDAVNVPVTLKMRLGWDEASRNAPELARMAQDAGIQALAVHGRTRCQFYKGAADWAFVAEVKSAVSIPLLVNGDIGTQSQVRQALARSRADGVMVGRAALGAPWLLADLQRSLTNAAETGSLCPGLRRDAIVQHYDDILRFYGREKGVRIGRKHVKAYLEAARRGNYISDPAKTLLWQRLCQEAETETVMAILPEIYPEQQAAAA